MVMVTEYDQLVRIEPREWPVYMSRVKQLYNSGFPAAVDEDVLILYGFAPVTIDPYPTGDVITQGQPEQREDGRWYVPWIVRSFTPEEAATRLAALKPSLLYSAEQHRVNQYKKGFKFTFTEGELHVQVGVEDRLNLHELNKTARARVADGDTTTIQFRVYENVFVELTPAEIVALTDLAVVKVGEAYQKVWDYKDLVRLAEVKEDLPEILGELFD